MQAAGASKEERMAAKLAEVKGVLVAIVQSGRQGVADAKAGYDGLKGDIARVRPRADPGRQRPL